MASSGMVNIGIVGTGFIAETRARCYAGVGGGYQPRIVAAASRTRARADDYARRHNVPDVYDDYQRILDRADVDVVEIGRASCRERVESSVGAGSLIKK